MENEDSDVEKEDVQVYVNGDYVGCAKVEDNVNFPVCEEGKENGAIHEVDARISGSAGKL